MEVAHNYDAVSCLAKLTEREVMVLAVQGYSNKEDCILSGHQSSHSRNSQIQGHAQDRCNQFA